MPACSPPTPWPRSPRRSAWRCRPARRRPAVDRRRDDIAYASGVAVMRLLEAGIRPRQIMTKEAFENAIATVMALGGSTNAVLHLLAIANEARVELALDDFARIGRRVPHLADMKPHGRYHMTDLDRIGGVAVVLRALLEEGLVNGDCLTVTGKTMAENLAALDPPAPDGSVVQPFCEPDPRRRRHRHARAARSPRRRGREGRRHRRDAGFHRPARVFDGEGAAMDAILAGSITPGTVVVIRYEGPKGGPGMREMLAVTGAMTGRGPGRRLRARHRRAFLRRHPRLLRRPRRARGRRRRADRPRRRRRRDRPGCSRGPLGRARRGRRARAPPRRLEAPGPALPDRGAGQVRPPRRRGRAGSGHRAVSGRDRPEVAEVRSALQHLSAMTAKGILVLTT